MRVAIMQPYFFPYIGYFQMMNAVDEFVVYDNIEYTKKGWISRNRILANGKDEYISLTVKKDSDYLNIVERFLADTWNNDKKKMLNKISESYKKAPFFKNVFPFVQECILYEEKNLFQFIFNSLVKTKEFLDIKTKLTISSTLNINHSLKAEKKVIAICNFLNADNYINPVGGIALYSKKEFKENDIDLHFLTAQNVFYSQFNNNFIPWLSIIDVLMFNSKERVKEYLTTNFILQ